MHLRNAAPVVLALPRGGVPVAAEIAAALDAPLDLVMARKIGHPMQPELAIGAVADGDHPETVRTAESNLLNVPGGYFEAETKRQLHVMAERHKRYLGGRKRPPLAGRAVILVDDGIATGATAQAALRSVRKARPSLVVLAVPVAPRDSLAMLAAEADEVVCLATPDPFYAIGAFYRDFPQTTDDEVVALLDAAAVRMGPVP